MEETPKSEGVSPSKSSSVESKGSTVSPSKSAPARGIASSQKIALRRFVAGDESEIVSVEYVDVSPSESTSAPAAPVEELANYKQLVARAVDVFGDEIKASKWLSLPNSELNGDTPLQVAQRDGYSGQLLEPIFTRIEHGIYF